ncbi:hypothetical protein ADL05_18605 [Nocardiopsis sp. NRRL B-16309]|nr:hypothetical protein ADL05_18605 [Nocardiopsis sp. NRRL B-16309]
MTVFMAVAALSGCHTHTVPPPNPAPSATTATAAVTPSPKPTSAPPEGRVRIPASDPDSATEVAESFVVAYWSYDARSDTADSRTERIRPYATSALLTQEQGARPPSAEWSRAQENDELVQITEPRAYRDPSAPEPNDLMTMLLIEGTRTITTGDGERSEPLPTQVLSLVNHDGAWYVNEFLR